ncbi:uncharacterized protein LOC118441959 isoform X1 [Vespa mandarinia]|uniref:uncharacterized protein LOC118441959 isoform X1 n=1 Tax=Vespa mandarinia TaxID=7446 RepID=UPI00161FBAB0|nr:uncharacterized protein LOC118441959 isoform X1 [Vespa mandarinia]XP_035722948.1 uncharacterized protein LOC118441959 isoform X1 [Vespa mandarinia]XP_035722949.1 uncharacterized protein LOC118441959 isoform X1 [Vespa mandarinia]XP_035722950.1 uncharacterized protein LOC118441959 isoform X1 [Vespa mandarinia]XP_035722952.1 uncharacterized protein LOC118441959 isoform X1 [Vespa mandarinia]
MLEREKVRTGAAITTALTVSTGNRISLDGVVSSLQLPNDRYACNPDSIYSVPRNDLHEVEWVEPDSVDAEVSRLVAGSSTTTTTTTITRNNPRRCCRTSTSSGYSSHSPPLSAGSYSCYASAVPGQSIFRSTAPQTMKDQFGGGLAVIHEGEAIPRPIWPSVFTNVSQEFYIRDDGKTEYDRMYTCCGCGCTYTYSCYDWNYGRPTGTSAREILLELSRTLNSVIEGETTMTPEEILQNISKTVAQGINLKKSSIYEYVRHNPAWLNDGKNASSILSSKNSSQSTGKDSSSLQSRTKHSSSSSSTRVNPVNSKVYGSTRRFYNSAWSTSRCTCDPSNRNVESSRCKKTRPELEKKSSSSTEIHCQKPLGLCTCKCFKDSTQQSRRKQSTCTSVQIGDSEKQSIVGLDGLNQNRNGLVSDEPEYTMQLECSDGGSSNEGIVVPSTKGAWNHHNTRGFIGDLDFTLDVTRAERLGRAIAKAKRNRQWCRALTTLFGLVFFVLSVVVVSLSVTRGRKVFGSM